MTYNFSSLRPVRQPFTDQWRESYTQKAAFSKVRHAENDYARRLRKIAQHIHDLVVGFVTREPGFPIDLTHLEVLLQRYSNILEPWARAVGSRFLSEIMRRDDRAWATYSKNFARALQQEIQTAPTGEALRQFLETQVQLITSLPLEAAERVHEIAIGNLYTSVRAGELREHILETSNVTRNRANLIARTETARIASTLVKVRAEHVGSPGYYWRTVRDQRVRASHREMEGQFVRWDQPPEVEPGRFYHAGMFPNCRCFSEVLVPDQFLAKQS